MRERTAAIIIVIIIIQILSGCVCTFKKTDLCNDEKYGPVAIRLAELSSQVVYYYRSKKKVVPPDFDAKQFTQILSQLPADQVNQKDVDLILSNFTVNVRSINDGFSIMLCEKSKKIMEKFANSHNDECKFDLNRVEV